AGDSSSSVAGGSMIGLGGPTGAGLGSLLGLPAAPDQLTSAAGPLAGGAGAGATQRTHRGGTAAVGATGGGPAGGAGGAAAGPAGVGMGGGGTGLQPSAGAGTSQNSNVTAISLSAAQVGGSQVRLNWNQLGLGAGVNYEIRRCSSFNSPTISCTVVATVQSS